MIDAKKIAEKIREIASFYAPDEDCTNAIYSALTAIIDELDPPEPEFKVGDWVEIEVAGVISQHRVKTGVFVDSINAGGFEFYGNGLPVMKPLNARIIRKLDPSEVVIRIGCLEGTVAPGYSDTTIMIVPMGHSGLGDVAIIPVAMLDARTRELAESLLKAQEESCHS